MIVYLRHLLYLDILDMFAITNYLKLRGVFLFLSFGWMYFFFGNWLTTKRY